MFSAYLLSLCLLSLLAGCLLIGMRPDGGYRKRCASIIEKVRGTRTPATGTTAGCSSFSAPGLRLADAHDLISPRRANSSTAPFLSIGGTATRGASGGRRERAVYVKWGRRRDEALNDWRRQGIDRAVCRDQVIQEYKDGKITASEALARVEETRPR